MVKIRKYIGFVPYFLSIHVSHRDISKDISEGVEPNGRKYLQTMNSHNLKHVRYRLVSVGHLKKVSSIESIFQQNYIYFG